MRMKLTEATLPNGKLIIKLIQPIEYGVFDCSWYGGIVATISCNNEEYAVIADGDVTAVLSDKKTGKEVANVKDKYNGGLFKNKMCGYIKNDAQLYEIMEKKNSEYTLCFLRNNLFEIVVNKTKSTASEYSFTTEQRNIFDAIVYAVEYMAAPF